MSALEGILEKVWSLRGHRRELTASLRRMESWARVSADRLAVGVRAPKPLLPRDPLQTMERIAVEVSARHGVEVEALRGRGRNKRICGARREFCREVRSRSLTLTEIGRYLDGRDHSTISSYLEGQA